jgi:O-antigen/teichoic acid export membrane protein
MYLSSYRLIFYLAVPGFSLLAISAPLVSELWVGYYEPVFVSAVIMLCIGWLINILGVPAYYSGMGTGHMKDNVIAPVTVAVTNIIAILVVGRLLDGMGVVVARVFAMILGAMLLMYLYHKRNSVALNEAIPESSRLLALLCVIGVTMSYLLWQWLPGLQVLVAPLGPLSVSLVHGIVNVIMILFFVLLVGNPMWNHPVRRQLSGLGTSGK